MKKCVLAVGFAAGLASMAGCATQQPGLEAQLAEAQAEAVAKSAQLQAQYWQSVALQQQLQLRERELEMLSTQEGYAVRLEELIADRDALEARMRTAEDALTEIAELEQDDRDGALPTKTASLLDEIARNRQSMAAKSDAYRELLSAMQHLVDTGKIHVQVTPGGQARFVLPRELDQVDPWQ